MDMAQERGQLGQPSFYISIASIPVQECANGKVMPQVVNARATATAAKLAQTGPTSRHTEPLPGRLIMQRSTSFPNEKLWTHRLRVELVTRACIPLERLHR